MDTEKLFHSAAHVMAAAVCRLYESVRIDIGPATANGFYYDFDLDRRLTPDDFDAIETEMRRLIDADLAFERQEVSRAEAEALFREIGQPYKLERLADIPEDAVITLYRCGDFVDLCRGPHLERTGQIPAFKLLSVAGSYFRGLETNPMLQRIYGIAAASEKDLRRQLAQVAEAEKRDHRRLGRELDLFSIQEDVGPGLILWHPRGARIRAVIEEYWRREHFREGYDLLFTPHIGRATLWEKSGHLGFYAQNMYAPMCIDEREYYVKPMNCPFHIQVYRSRPRSYRDLPLRWAEMGTVYRYEKTGVLHGLLRVRGFTQDDAHIICTPDQMIAEIRRAVRLARRMWQRFGFADISAYLATRPAKAVGETEHWDQAIAGLEQVLREENIAVTPDAGGGAFYGPKIDMKVRDALGREWQMSTIQFDFNMPERFDMTYIGEDGQPHRPTMIHRALLGSLERFLGILIEHYGGAFPLWLAPEQVRVLPLTEKQLPAGEALLDHLQRNDFRATLDRRSEKIGAKIRDGRLERIPYLLILGPREADTAQVSVRCREKGDLGAMPVEDLLDRLRLEMAESPPSEGL